MRIPLCAHLIPFTIVLFVPGCGDVAEPVRESPPSATGGEVQLGKVRGGGFDGSSQELAFPTGWSPFLAGFGSIQGPELPFVSGTGCVDGGSCSLGRFRHSIPGAAWNGLEPLTVGSNFGVAFLDDFDWEGSINQEDPNDIVIIPVDVNRTAGRGPTITIKPFSGSWALRTHYAFVWNQQGDTYEDRADLTLLPTVGGAPVLFLGVTKDAVASDAPALDGLALAAVGCGGNPYCTGWQVAEFDLDPLLEGLTEFGWQFELMMEEFPPAGAPSPDYAKQTAFALEDIELIASLSASGLAGDAIELVAPYSETTARNFSGSFVPTAWDWNLTGPVAAFCAMTDEFTATPEVTCQQAGEVGLELSLTTSNSLETELDETELITGTLTVLSSSPTATVAAAPALLAVGGTVTAAGAFTDPLGAALPTATLDWGDGATTAGVVAGTAVAGTVGGSHTYLDAGVYVVTLTVTTGTNGTATAESDFVVVYDPTAGFVTGGGWINSPVTTLPAMQQPGQARFGFVSKYQKGKTVPQGGTVFVFEAGGISFASSSYEWLVVAGAKAVFKGVGTVNGGGNFGFLLSAVDGDLGGGDGVDRFRIKIWDRDQADLVIYDNQVGSGDGAAPTTAIEAGQIVVHAAKK